MKKLILSLFIFSSLYSTQYIDNEETIIGFKPKLDSCSYATITNPEAALALSTFCYLLSAKKPLQPTQIPKEHPKEIDLFREPPPPIIKNW